MRTIPTLLLDGPGLVKGERFADHKYVGDPINAVKIFNDKEVDEIVILDITARHKTRVPNYEFIADIASQAFMPFGYGGALDDLDAIETVLRLGAEKVVLNTSALERPELVREASSALGSQSIVVSIDVRPNRLGRYHVWTNSGSTNTKRDPVEVAQAVEADGAGEIMLCGIHREGTGEGYDLDIIERVSHAVDIPVIAAGGAGSTRDFGAAIGRGASACAAGDMFTFRGKFKAVLISYPSYHELEEAYAGVTIDR